jgi:TolB-like protein
MDKTPVIVEPFSNEVISHELENILASKGFVHSPLLSRFLRFVVEQTLAGKAHEIKEYTVGKEVLGKPFDFNPMVDASVRINAVRLRRLLDEYYRALDWKHEVRIDLPKGTYVPVFASYNDNSEWHPHKNAAIRKAQENDHQEDIICIVPFTGFINHEALDFSVDGFCEYLSEKLSLFQDVSVVAFLSSYRYLQEGGNLETLGKDLGATYDITGSIEVEKNHMLVSVQLVETKSNAVIWSHNFPAELEHTSIISIIDDITSSIVSSLAGYSGVIHFRKFSRSHEVPAITNKAANALFWFYHFQAHHTPELFLNAIKQLEQIVHGDDENASCLAVLAHLYASSLVFNYHIDENPLNKAMQYATRAEQLDPHNQHAHLSLGWINILLGNKVAATAHLAKCDSINPNAAFFKAIVSLGFAFLGDYERSNTFLQKALLLNPIAYWWLHLPYVFIALKHHEYEKVLFHARKVGTPALLHEHIFEMIALYYLDDTKGMYATLKMYKQKYPEGLMKVKDAWSAVLFDKELLTQITTALDKIMLYSQKVEARKKA